MKYIKAQDLEYQEEVKHNDDRKKHSNEDYLSKMFRKRWNTTIIAKVNDICKDDLREKIQKILNTTKM